MRGPAAYCTVIALGDGTLGVLYEGGDSSSVEKITFAGFNLEWVKAGTTPVMSPAMRATGASARQARRGGNTN